MEAALLKLNITKVEIAEFVTRNDLSYDNVYYIPQLFDTMVNRKKAHIVDMMLKLSRLPTVHPCTFDSFDFHRFHGRQADELENLQTLSALQSRANLLLVGPQGRRYNTFSHGPWR